MTGNDSPLARSLRKPLIAALLWLVGAGTGQAEMAPFDPPGLLVADISVKLAMVPDHVALAPDAVYVAGTTRAGAQLLRLNPADLAQLSQIALDFAVLDILARPADNRVYVLGNTDLATELLVLDADLRLISRFSIGQLLAAPTLSAAGDGLLAIAGLPYDLAEGGFFLIDIQSPESPRLREKPQFPIAARGVAMGWFNAQDDLAFLNLADATVLLALAAETGLAVSDISGPQSKDRGAEPFAVQAFMPDQPCTMGSTATFLISDAAHDRLMLAEFSPNFKTLNILSEVEPGLGAGAPSFETQRQAGTPVLRPRGLLASSCNRGVVWGGALTSAQVVQYAVNPTFHTLEKVGTLVLPSQPVALMISDDGSTGFAVLANGQIQRFAAPPDNSGFVTGTADVRTLQRALTEKGYPVGTIDGLLGARTQKAIAQFQSQSGVFLDPKLDIDAAIGIISTFGN